MGVILVTFGSFWSLLGIPWQPLTAHGRKWADSVTALRAIGGAVGSPRERQIEPKSIQDSTKWHSQRLLKMVAKRDAKK